MSRILLATVLSVLCCTATAQEKKSSKATQRREEIKLLEKEMRGEPDKRLKGTTVDLVTDDLAISVAWAEYNAWEPAIGQSLHHAVVLEKKPAVVLLRTKDDDEVVERCCQVCRTVGIQVILRDITNHKSEDGYTPRAQLAAFAAIRKAAAPGGKATLSGVVTIDGKPLPSGKIIFHPSKGEPFPAKINEDGAFTVEVPVGEMRVTIDFPRLPKKYTDPAETGLSVTVKAGENIVRFELTSR